MEHRGALGWGIHSPVTCLSGAIPVFGVLAPLASVLCHACECARVDPAMQVINADDAGELFQWLSLSWLEEDGTCEAL